MFIPAKGTVTPAIIPILPAPLPLPSKITCLKSHLCNFPILESVKLCPGAIQEP